MSKILKFLPAVSAVALSLWALFGPGFQAYVASHHAAAAYVGFGLIVSEGLAGLPFIQANSVTQLVVNTLVSVFTAFAGKK